MEALLSPLSDRPPLTKPRCQEKLQMGSSGMENTTRFNHIYCITEDPGKELLVRLRNLQNTDPYEGSKRKKVVRKLFQDYQLALMVSSREDAGIIVDCLHELSKLLAPIFQWKQCRGYA